LAPDWVGSAKLTGSIEMISAGTGYSGILGHQLLMI